MKTTQYLLHLVFGVVCMAHAQSVDSLVSEALARYPRLTALDYQIRATDHQAAAAGALPAPSLGVEFSQVPLRQPDLLNGAVSNDISVSQMFMLGGKLSAMADVERQRGRVLLQNRASLAVSVRSQVKMAYARLWLLDRRLEVQEETLVILAELATAIRSQVLTNRMRQADLLAVQAELAAEQARLATMRTERLSAQNSLYILLGRDEPTSDIVTDKRLHDSIAVFDPTLWALSTARSHPELLAMDRMKEMNLSEIDVARRDLIPDLMVQGMLMRMPNGMLLTSGPRSVAAVQMSAAGMAMPGSDWMIGVMASITLPFMPWSVERSSRRIEAFEALNAGIEAERVSMRRELLATLRSAQARYQTSDSLVRDYEQTILPLMRSAADAQTTAYQNGLVPISSVLDARRMELMRKEDHLMAAADRSMALAEIEMMLGEPLKTLTTN